MSWLENTLVGREKMPSLVTEDQNGEIDAKR